MSKNAETLDVDLDKAAQSPDPVIRRMALRRMEIETEKAAIDNFLGLYDKYKTELPGEKSTAAAKPAAARASAPRTQRSVSGVGGGLFTKARSDELMDAVRDVLTEVGVPMRLAQLCDGVVRLLPEAAGQKERLRLAMSNRPDRIVSVGRKYWLADAHVQPLESEDSDDGDEDISNSRHEPSDYDEAAAA